MALMTVRAAAERIGIGYSTLTQWIHQGKIRTTQTAGGHHRLSDAEVDRLMSPRAPNARPAVVTSDALRELNLRRGDDALAIIKSTVVMTARETRAASRRKPTKRG